MNWREENEGPKWISTLHAAEDKYSIPRDLLARICYQECHFRSDIIDGTVKSSAGAVGIMQLMPQFFPGAGADPVEDIDKGGRYLASLYTSFGDWQKAVAAYNWGPGHVHRCLQSGMGLASMPKETQDYVTDVCGDTGVGGALIPELKELA